MVVTIPYNELPLSGHLSKFSENYNTEVGAELERLFNTGERQMNLENLEMLNQGFVKKLGQSHRLMREVKFNLSQVLASQAEKYQQFQFDKPKTIEIVPQTNRYYFVETRGCASPLTIKIEYI